MSNAIDFEIFKKGFRSLRRQGIKTYLTTLGVVIGIAAIVALLLIGQGLNQSVQDQFEQMGSNTLIVLPGSSMVQSVFAGLEADDPRRIESIQGVESVNPVYFEAVEAYVRDEKRNIVIMGVEPEDQEGLSGMGMLTLAEGRQLSNSDKFSVIVGSSLAEEGFDKELQLKQKIIVNGKALRIVGITKATGSSFGSMFDSAVIMSKDGLEELTGKELVPFRIPVKTFTKEDVPEVKEKITRVLEKAHGEEDFQIMTSSQMQGSADAILGLINAVLIGIAAISLLVGAIGIMNTMFMSVLERTKEIGIMKSVGATNKMVRNIFLVESGVIGMGGGIIGLIVGFVIAVIVSVIATMSGFAMSISPDPMIFVGSIAFAMIVGMVAGYIPAKNAAEMDPVDALSRE
ncbi:MAG: ABC transporter permease [Candidatus Diapherotrites archaeon]